MLNLDTLLSPLPYLLHPFLPATLLLANLLFTSPQSSASYTPKALSLWCSVAIILSLLNALNSYLVSVEALERDGLRALFDNSILGRRKSKSKRVVKWNEEIVLVTGGAGGLGREIVRLCVARGARGVAVVDVVGGRDVEDEQEQGTKTRVKGYVCDVGNAEEVQKLREMVARDVRSLFALVMCAAVTMFVECKRNEVFNRLYHFCYQITYLYACASAPECICTLYNPSVAQKDIRLTKLSCLL